MSYGTVQHLVLITIWAAFGYITGRVDGQDKTWSGFWKFISCWLVVIVGWVTFDLLGWG